MKYDKSFDSGNWFLIVLLFVGLLAFILIISPESRNPKDITQFALILFGIPFLIAGEIWIFKKFFTGFYYKIKDLFVSK